MERSTNLNKPFVTLLDIAVNNINRSVNEPTWNQVEDAIISLNKDTYGGFVTILDEDETKSMTIFGQQGAYHIGIIVNEEEFHYYWDGSKPDEASEIPIAGNFFKEHQICYDFEKLIKIAKYFYDTGECLEEVFWESEILK